MNALITKLRHDLVDDWYIKSDPTSSDRARLLRCQYTSNLIRALIQGTFWTGLLLCMKADDASIGTIGMISSAAGMLQILGPLFLERFKKRKTMLICMRAVMWLFNVLIIGVIPILPIAQGAKMALMVGSVLAVNVLNTFVGPGVAIWHMQSIPEKVRGGYYSLLTMTNGAIIATMTFFGGLIVDSFADPYYGLVILRIAALMLCVLELYMYTKVPEYPYGENKSARFSVKDLLIKPFKNPLYLMTVAVGFTWNFAANIPGSYYSVYLLQDLNLSYSWISLVGAMNVPIVLLLTPLWKKQLKRMGWFKTLSVSMMLYSCVYLLMSQVNSGTAKILYPVSQLTAFFLGIGISLSFTGVPWVNIPKENQTVFYGFYQTIMYFAAFAGVTVGKYFILGVGDTVVNIAGVTMCGKQLIVLLTGALVFTGGVIVAIIHKKADSQA